MKDQDDLFLGSLQEQIEAMGESFSEFREAMFPNMPRQEIEEYLFNRWINID